ncbi:MULTISPECIES: DUF1656 domain-containing protein [Leptospirillum]|jgi:hypothetical protein|uniref:Membrane protein n=2 Tax=Leptospirillum ferriphilum TaxID=178606 RepID=A0A059XQW4_9BACT|nr:MULTISPECIES: DUF1656 domain-containing protein [Leptospirillum]EAY56388.1 MAG: conserved hypothetical protein [Leptospirillum rubarum]EIJ75037.1 MAG: hypothetical protein C75L2_00370052 [Leptospirillum sp. Group II 'C75']AIA30984.1 membrane protein [Leptospirillum ferriphilum YSK]AKS24087.1 membrane protein [Leptospirillum sp. Group II 'CF-1']OOH74303.1 hypothetical protein BOX24_02370 [Leptospirillum ferriphilum]
MKEMDFFGVFLSPFLAWALFAFVLLWGIRFLLFRLGFYRYVWHRSLFDISLYLIVLTILVFYERSLPE